MPRKSSARPVPGPVAPLTNQPAHTQTNPRAPLPPPSPATYAQRAAPNAASLRATAWHFDATASYVPTAFATSPVTPPPAPIHPQAARFDLATARAIFAVPAPPANAGADVTAAATSRRRLAQALVDSIEVGASVLF